jgi:hypothetical protein
MGREIAGIGAADDWSTKLQRAMDWIGHVALKWPKPVSFMRRLLFV